MSSVNFLVNNQMVKEEEDNTQDVLAMERPTFQSAEGEAVDKLAKQSGGQCGLL